MMTRPATRALLCATVALFLNACATLPPDAPRSPQDPYERWNRSVFRLNSAIDRGIAKPAARSYVRIVPQSVRTGVGNFFSNLKMPATMINDALQGKLRAAGTDLGRFVVNSTIGVAGLLDPATPMGMAHNKEDFGQTLGKWGVHAGPFLELPLLGPSDMRDAPGLVVEIYMDPRHYLLTNSSVDYGLYAVNFLDARASLLPLDSTLSKVYDPYAFIRDAYLQHRQYLISDGKSAPQDAPLDPDAP
jgi:phospholipid-binding lipoprotein MlaA